MRKSTFTETERPTEPSLTNSALLSEVAATLLRLPFEDSTRNLHIRALRLKRQIDPWWDEARPTEADLRAMRESILALRSEAVAWLTGR